jgi:hypothetical protein
MEKFEFGQNIGNAWKEIKTYMKHFAGHRSRHALALLVPPCSFQVPGETSQDE